MRFSLTLHILAAGTALKVRRRLAFTPGGGSNTNTREALSKFTGTWYIQITLHFRDLNPQQLSILYFRDTKKRRALKSESTHWLASFLQARLNLRKKHSRAKSFSAFWLCVNVCERKNLRSKGSGASKWMSPTPASSMFLLSLRDTCYAGYGRFVITVFRYDESNLVSPN